MTGADDGCYLGAALAGQRVADRIEMDWAQLPLAVRVGTPELFCRGGTLRDGVLTTRHVTPSGYREETRWSLYAGTWVLIGSSGEWDRSR